MSVLKTVDILERFIDEVIERSDIREKWIIRDKRGNIVITPHLPLWNIWLLNGIKNGFIGDHDYIACEINRDIIDTFGKDPDMCWKEGNIIERL